ncbi:MAG TPA: hypothetical protein DCO89_02890, partial [Clostridiales bacterium]|nr:hypothetical protein [Clostridiales bacterium]
MFKQYGVTKPKSLDYLLAILFAVVCVSALWIGIWIALTKTQTMAMEVLLLTLRALTGDLVGTSQVLVSIECVIFYGAALVSFILFVLAAVGKKPKAFAGAFALLLSASSFVLEIGFFVQYLYSEVFGLFYVFILLFAVIQLIVTYYIVKLLYSVVIKQSKAYESYKSEFPSSDNVKIIEVEVPAEEQKEQEEQEEEEEEEEEQEEENEQNEEFSEPEPTEEEKPQEYVDDVELIYDNSNSYLDYMYHDGLVKYMNDEGEEIKSPVMEKDAEGSKFGGVNANNYTFEQKLKIAKPVARQYFKELKKYFESLGFTAELTKHAETFSYKNVKYAMITTAGQSGLKIYYKLNVKDYKNSTIPVKSVEKVKKYEKTPLLFVAKSDLAVKRAKMLMDDVKKQYIGEDVEVVSVKEEPKKEIKPKVIKSKLQSKPKVKKEAKVESPQEVDKVEPVEQFIQEGVFGGIKGNHYTFEQKLNMAQPVVRKYFKELTKYFVELGFTPAVTKSSQTFSYKNVKYAMITTAGKSGLKIYYKLNPEAYTNSTIPVKSMAKVKKYEKTPLLFVAKS